MPYQILYGSVVLWFCVLVYASIELYGSTLVISISVKNKLIENCMAEKASAPKQSQDKQT